MPAPTARRRASALWSDIQLVRRLRGRSGILVGTRPGVNMMLARLQAPGLRTIGLEQMNLGKHNARPAPRDARATTRKLDALVVLTEQDRDAYRRAAGRRRSRCTASPTPCGLLPGAKADLSAKTVYAAGRFRYQKGFELLIPAWAETAKAHPDWRCGCAGAATWRAASAG